MIKGVDISQKIEFVSKYDDGEEKTIFVFQPLSSEKMLDYVGDTNNGVLVLTGAKIFDFLGMAITEIKNFENQKETVRETIKTLPLNILTELVTEAGKINKITEQDRKN